MLRLVLPVVLAVGIVGCATTTSESSDSYTRSADRISRAEIDDRVPEATTAYEIVERLRSSWLRPRGSVGGSGNLHRPEAFFDGRHIGGVGSLRQVHVDEIAAIRFLDSQDATTRYGTGYPGGIIAVVRRR